MVHIILPNLLVELFFVYLIVESFKKISIYYLTIRYIIVYCTTIISNILNKLANYIESTVVKS